MDLTGEYRIPAPRERVWRALNDPEVLRQAIPGCEEIAKLSDTEFTAKVAVKLGPVSARFGGKVTLSDLDPPNGYRITGEGQGGAAGFAKGGATVKLAPAEGDATLLSYAVEASVGGKIAQIGSRLIDGSARKLADQFFGRFAEIVAAEVSAGLAPAAPEAAAAPPIETAVASKSQPATPAGRPRGLAPAIWIGGLVIIVVALLLLFGL
jgi:carbon monoxide dehydrogenase subunit G